MRRTLTKKMGSDEGEADTAPARKGRRPQGTLSGRTTTGGWGAYDSKRRLRSENEQKWKPNCTYLVKFLQDAPFDVYLQHWIDEIKKGKRSFVCYEGEDEECPLDTLGDNPSPRTLFNTLVFGEEDEAGNTTMLKQPALKVWVASVTAADKIKRLSQAKRTQPLDRDDLYFRAAMNKTAYKSEWDITPLKADDLADDGWKIEPLTAGEIDKFRERCHADRSAVVTVDTLEALKDIAAKISGDDDDEGDDD